MSELPLPPDFFPPQGFPHEPNASTPHQAGTSPLEIWYSGVVNQTAYTTVSATFNQIFGYPVVIGRSGILDQIGFEVTTGAGGGSGGVARAAIYNSNSSGFPNSLVVDGGEKSTEANAVLTSSISVYVEAGLYWFCLWPGVATATVRAGSVGAISAMLGVPTTMGASGYGIINKGSQAYNGAWPTAFPTTNPSLVASSLRMVHVRFSV